MTTPYHESMRYLHLCITPTDFSGIESAERISPPSRTQGGSAEKCVYYTQRPFRFLRNDRWAFQRASNLSGSDVRHFQERDRKSFVGLRRVGYVTRLGRILGQLIHEGLNYNQVKCQAFPDSIDSFGHIIGE